MRTYLTGVAIAVLLLAGGAFGTYRYADSQLHRPLRTGQPALTVNIPGGTGVTGVADLLAHDGVISNALLFEAYVRINGIASTLEAGQYRIPGGLSTVEVAELLQRNRHGHEVTITIPEGLTETQIAALVESKGLMTAHAYLAEAKTGTFTEDFTSDRPAGATLEGYLFPDTYSVKPDIKVHDLIDLQLRTFAAKVPPSLRAQTAGHHLSFHDALTLASIVEREARFDVDRTQIAEVFYNRLAIGMSLDADSTLLYAEGRTSGPVTAADKNVNSPYNTYMHAGVPPGPICSPGLASIKASLQPAGGNYLYFVTDKDGHAHFATTLAQQNQNVQLYGSP